MNENEKSNEAFRPALIDGLDPAKTKIRVKYISESKGPDEVKLDAVLERSEERKAGVEDLVNLECLNDAELLINLQKRFENHEIFTYVGPTLLVVNPYETFANLFSAENLDKYHKFIQQPQLQMKDLPPHVWALTGEAYRNLFEMEKNQALVISGESGAGKTENTKYAMKFLTSFGKMENNKRISRKSLIGDLQVAFNKKEETIEDKVILYIKVHHIVFIIDIKL